MTDAAVVLPTLEELHDRWLEAVRDFHGAPTESTKDAVLQRYQAYYRKRNGSSVGLDDQLREQRRRMNIEIEKGMG